MRVIVILAILILALGLVGCSGKTLDAAEEPAADTTEPAEPAEPADTAPGGEETASAEPDEPAEPEPLVEDSVEATTDSSDDTTSVTAVMDGAEELFTLTGTDPDDIVFQVAKKYNKPLNSIRDLIIIDGESYSDLTGMESSSAEDTGSDDSDSDDETTTEPAEPIEYLVEKEEGYLRAVGCDFENGILKFKVHNPEEEDLPFFLENRIPQISHSLRISLNQKVVDEFDCGEDIPAKSTLECEKTDDYKIMFMAEKYQGKDDKITVTMPGVFEQLTFSCQPNNETEVNEE